MSGFTPSPDAEKASRYYNALPLKERAKLAPLLEHYRQMGLAEAQEQVRDVANNIGRRIQGLKGKMIG